MKTKKFRWAKLLVLGGAGLIWQRTTEFRWLLKQEWPPTWSWGLKSSILIILAKHLRFLRQTDHWDQAALQAYLTAVQVRVSSVASAEVRESLVDGFEQTQQVGSLIYTLMYEQSRRSAKQKLRLVLRHLGGQVDHAGFLQLQGTHDLAPDLAPHAEFYAAIRANIWQAYPTKEGLNADELGARLHLLRSWFDRQNLQYVRRNFTGLTDWEKLQAYAIQAHQPLDLTTNAAFHNRSEDPESVPQNFKVQLPAHNTANKKRYNNARMAEFIVDLTSGQFVSEWNAYEVDETGWVKTQVAPADLVQVANTESLNYGIPHGAYANLGKRDRSRHQNLDVEHPADPAARRQATRVLRSPATLAHGGPYVDLVKQLPDLAAWQAVPPAKRSAAYAHYRQVCQQVGTVRGYASLDKTGRI